MKFTRRNILSFIGTTPLLGLSASVTATSPKRMLRIAYFTDIHLPPIEEVNKRAEKAFALAKDCDLFLFGGDNLMAIDHRSETEVQAHYKNWTEFTAKNLKKPYRAILGNHDVEQWDLNDPTFNSGKTRPVHFFGMKNRFWEEKMAGWRLVGLDTVHRNGDRFMGLVDPEQLEWLKGILSDKLTPTLVCGHMPMLSVTALADSGLKPTEAALPISFASEVSNARDVVKIFRENGNVKLCLSGHTHMIDRCDFGGTSYVCAGAVCGGWWNGANQGFPPAYTQVDLMADGTFALKTVFWEHSA
jgi:3',5'-cyclic AMP phosphodiesterase CpdA